MVYATSERRLSAEDPGSSLGIGCRRKMLPESLAKYQEYRHSARYITYHRIGALTTVQDVDRFGRFDGEVPKVDKRV